MGVVAVVVAVAVAAVVVVVVLAVAVAVLQVRALPPFTAPPQVTVRWASVQVLGLAVTLLHREVRRIVVVERRARAVEVVGLVMQATQASVQELV